MKHIPTLTIVYYEDIDGYGYTYDDADGNTQEQGVFPSYDNALGSAGRHLRTFYLMPDIINRGLPEEERN